ncbi:MAG: hypothetical protein QOJ95_1467 [Mycobacterium sp.]|nr:hypothetical protein [Mycobacterium sp.]
MFWGSTPYNGGPDGAVGRLIASSAAVSISDNSSWMIAIIHDCLRRRNRGSIVEHPLAQTGISSRCHLRHFGYSVRGFEIGVSSHRLFIEYKPESARICRNGPASLRREFGCIAR